ncbi:MAG: hypothetical protein DRR06_19940, partial [Gammaproteobacteria bacterium]
MTVATPVVALWDGVNRRAHLAQGVAEFFPIEDLYHEYRNERRTNEAFRGFNPMMRAEGNIPKGAGAFTPRYVVLLEGFKLIPYDESLQLNQLGDMITDDPDTDATLYDISGLTTAKPIFIAPSEAETIQLNQGDIEYASFGNAVTLDAISGSDENKGNIEFPVKTAVRAIQIATGKGFDTINVIGNYTFSAGDDISGLDIAGQSMVKSTILVLPDALSNDCIFTNATLLGTLDGGSTIKNCFLTSLAYVNGFILDCILGDGTITLAGGVIARFVGCKSGTASEDAVPTIDFGGAGQELVVSDYVGLLKLQNKTGTDDVNVSMLAGSLTLDSSIINGDIVLTGSGELENNVTAPAYVVDRMQHSADTANLQRVIEMLRPHHTGTGKLIFWDPYGGDDSRPGDHITRAVKTFAEAHDHATNAGHDIIIAVPGAPSGPTISNEIVNIAKDYTFLRGPGRDFIIKSSTNASSPISINGNGVEVSGMIIEHTGSNAISPGIDVSGDFVLLENLFIENCNDSIVLHNCNNGIVHACDIGGNHGNGIQVSGTSQHTTLKSVIVGNNNGSGIVVMGTTAGTGIIGDTVLFSNTGYGLDIGSDANIIAVTGSVSIFGNAAGDVRNSSSTAYIEESEA